MSGWPVNPRTWITAILLALAVAVAVGGTIHACRLSRPSTLAPQPTAPGWPPMPDPGEDHPRRLKGGGGGR